MHVQGQPILRRRGPRMRRRILQARRRRRRRRRKKQKGKAVTWSHALPSRQYWRLSYGFALLRFRIFRLQLGPDVQRARRGTDGGFGMCPWTPEKRSPPAIECYHPGQPADKADRLRSQWRHRAPQRQRHLGGWRRARGLPWIRLYPRFHATNSQTM